MDTHTSITREDCILGVGDVYSNVEVKVEEDPEQLEVEPDLNVFSSDGLYNISYSPNEVTEEHTSKEPYQCNKCEESFSKINDLIDHRKTHIGEKLYQCSHCDECFTDMPILERHMEVHNEENIYEGNQYTKGFEQKKIKRKHVSLTLEKKIELLKRLEKKEKIKDLMAEYDIGRSTVYEIKKDVNKILKEIKRCDSKDVLKRRKNMHNSRNIELDKVLYAWVKQMRNEGVFLSDLALKNQAQRFNDQLNCDYRTKPLQFSYGWLTRFKARYGLGYISTSEDNFSTDSLGVDKYIAEFESFRNDNKLNDEQIFNCNETGLFWSFIGERNFALHTEITPGSFRDNTDMLTVLACANQAGTFKNKLVVIGKSENPIAFKGARIPVNWYSSKNAYMTEVIFTNWIKNEFLPEARKHLLKIGLDPTCKIVLTLDNCSAHPSAEYLENLDVHKQLIVKPLPPNMTSLLQPMDQGILRSLKFRYKLKLITSMLDSLNKGENVMSFLKDYSILHALYALHSSWLDVPQSTIQNGWGNLCPPLLAKFGIESVNVEAQKPYQGFEAQSYEEQQIITELIDYNSRTIAMTNVAITQEDIIEVMESDRNASTVQILSGDEILHSLLKEKEEGAESDNYYGEKPGFNGEEDIPLNELINMCDKLLIGIQRRDCIPDDDVMVISRIKERLAKHSMDQFLKTNKEG